MRPKPQAIVVDTDAIVATRSNRGRSSTLRQGLIARTLWAVPRLRSRFWQYIPRWLRRRATPPVMAIGYECFNEAERVPEANFEPDFELYQAAELLGTVGTFHGPEALNQVIAELRDAFDDVRFRPVSIKTVDDERYVAIVRFSGTGRGSGVGVDREIAHVWRIRDGLASRLEVYWEPADAARSPILAR